MLGVVMLDRLASSIKAGFLVVFQRFS